MICNESECYPLVFQPTHEFQIIKSGQRIPKGLHVRIDWTTGKKEAKIDDGSVIDPKESISQTRQGSLDVLIVENKDNDQNDQNSIQNDNSNIKDDKSNSKEEQTKVNQENIEKIKQNLKEYIDKKRYTQIEKQESGPNILFQPTQKSKLSNDQINEFQLCISKISTVDESEIPNTLQDIIEQVHDVDYAVLLTEIDNGLNVIESLMEHNNSNIRILSTLVIGVSTQNNPKVQEQVLKYGFLEYLLHRLGTETHTKVVSKLLFSLGSLVRSNHHALDQFSDLNGFARLFIVYTEYPSVRTKIVTLLTDIVDPEMYSNDEIVLKFSDRVREMWCLRLVVDLVVDEKLNDALGCVSLSNE